MSVLQLFSVYGSTSALGLHRFTRQTTLTKRLSHQPDHWTMASSRDVFSESSRVVKSAQNVALALIGGITVLGAAVRVSDAISQPYSYSGEDLHGEVKTVCGPEFNLCHLAYTSYAPGVMAISGAMLYIFCLFLLTPVRAWSPVFQVPYRRLLSLFPDNYCPPETPCRILHGLLIFWSKRT
jgi:hypothetical protein